MRTLKMVIAIYCVLSAVSCGSQLKPSAETFAIGSWESKTSVLTKYGTVNGREDLSNTYSWKGIPYAKPPIGELRWKAPREPQAWIGVLEADRFGNVAPQLVPVIGVVQGSEDCLYLNVWRPRTVETNLPVYIYVHGGGNSLGSAHQTPEYFGHHLATSMNAVYISINYRLGPLGWLTYPALKTGESKEDDSGNYGILDIIASLKWVQANIKAFGGDPNRVFIAGESAGAINILSLLTSPLAQGLFHGAIIESGMTLISSVETGYKHTHQMLIQLLIGAWKASTPEQAEKTLSNMSAKEIRAFLYSRTPAQLISVLQTTTLGMLSFPYLFTDGTVLPTNGYKVFEDGSYPVKVPIIIGCNKDEVKLFIAFDKTLDPKTELYQAIGKYLSQLWKVYGVDWAAHQLTKTPGQPSVFAYRFDWGSLSDKGVSVLPGDRGQKYGAYHSLEVPFFIGGGEPRIFMMTGNLMTEQNRNGRVKLAYAINRYLASFIHSDNPNLLAPKELPVWYAWTNAQGAKKSIVWNADNDNFIYSYLTNELSFASISNEIANTLTEPIRSEVLNRLVNRRFLR